MYQNIFFLLFKFYIYISPSKSSERKKQQNLIKKTKSGSTTQPDNNWIYGGDMENGQNLENDCNC